MLKTKLHTILIETKFKLYYNTLFRWKTHIRRLISHKLKYSRPPSLPFITGDGFRAIAQHVFDDLETVQHSDVARGDIIFVRSDLLLDYFTKIHPRIKNKYILISHNSDKNIDSQFFKYIDENIIHWFAQNLVESHEKITPIPIGIQLRIYDPKNKVMESLIDQQIITEKQEKEGRISNIFYSFSEETNTKRSLADKFLKQHPVAIGPTKMLSRKEYYENVSKYKFNASPEGAGIDCHRTWETLYLKAIPIVEKSASTEYWSKIGLPLYIIDSWSKIDTIDTQSIVNFYLESYAKFDSPALYMEYWITKILKCRQNNKI